VWGVSRAGHLIVDTTGQRHTERVRLALFLIVVVGVALVTAGAAYITSPQPLSLALIGVILAGWAAFVRPATGVYTIVFFSLVGDSVATPWWPFTKNLSMRESIFFVHDQLPIAPLDMVLFTSWAAFVLRSLVESDWRFRRGRVLAPLLVLGGFVMMGIVRGLSTGGLKNVAVFEFRPFLYLIALYALIPNVLVTRTQFRIAFGLAVAAVSVHSLFALRYYRTVPEESRELISSLAEHPATLTMNLVFILLIGFWAFGAPRWLRRAGLVSAIPIVFAFFLAQRRAGVVALIVGLLMFTVVLLMVNRRAFMKVVPLLAAAAVVFVIATWNAKGALGLGSDAVKTVLFPEALGDEDRLSNDYRTIENYNLWFTIRSSPLFGLGFGQPFHVVWPMPDISWFGMWQYFSHNSVLWVWIKTGFFGFVTMLFTFARVIQRGSHATLRNLRPSDRAMVTAALAYPIMFLTFAYVDIAFSIRPIVMLALCFAICADFEPAHEDRPVSPPTGELEVEAPDRGPRLRAALAGS
jgi:O-antigen ligase